MARSQPTPKAGSQNLRLASAFPESASEEEPGARALEGAYLGQ